MFLFISKKSFSLSTVIGLFLLGTNLYADQCTSNEERYRDNNIGLHYSIEQSSLNNENVTDNHQHKGANINSELFTIWRRDAELAQQNETKQITEYWYLLKNGQLKPVRYFDEYERAIEYQPNDIRTERGAEAWLAKTRIITPSQLKKMTQIGAEKIDCVVVETYRLNEKDRVMKLQWLPQYQAIKTLEVTSETRKERWELVDITLDREKIDNAFAVRAAYFSTDYADIGDNESDPFLLKMMKLGFIANNHSH